MSQDQYGSVVLINQILSVINIFIIFGINVNFTKLYLNKNQDNIIFNTILINIVFFICIYIILFIIYTIFIKNSLIIKIILINGSGILFASSLSVLNFIVLAELKSKYIFTIKSVLTPISIITKIYLLRNYHQIDLIFTVSSIEALLSSVIIFTLIKNKIINKIKFEVNFNEIKNILQRFSPLMLMSLLLHIYTKIDSYMISYFLGLEELAKYNVGTKFSVMIYPLAAIITNSFYPELINCYNNSRSIFLSKLRHFYRISFVISFIISLLLFFFANKLIIFFYGERYFSSCAVQSIHSWTIIFMFTIIFSSRWFLLKNYNGLLFMRALFGSLINIFLNIILVPKYGINGAALSTLFSLFFVAYMFDLFCKKTRLNLYYKLHIF